MNKKQTLAFDVETTTINFGDPYNPDNKLVAVGIGGSVDYKTFDKEDVLYLIQEDVNDSILVGHNIKFDLAWLRRIGIDLENAIVRDTQLAEFLITNQTNAFSSLEELAVKYLNEHKDDVVKKEYWDKGIDTWFIPKDILLKYLRQDLYLTISIYLKQEQILKEQGKWPLYLLQCEDLLSLEEMQWNGIYCNKEKCISKGDALQEEINRTKKYIKNYTECPSFNTGSTDHLSALLYGGIITEELRIPIGVYKSGPKIGQPRFKIEKKEYKQERLIIPIKGSALKKKGPNGEDILWSTDEFTLKTLKPISMALKMLISDILQLSKLEKLQQTYFYGIPKLMDSMNWKDNLIHGQFNQCVARTGRLSASKPNQQNFDPEMKRLCETRYA